MKNNSNLLAWAILFLSPIISIAQVDFSIKGKIIIEDGYLPSGNVIALHPTDSTFLTGDSFFDGIFELNNLTEEEVLIQFSSLEFEDTFLKVKYNREAMVDLGDVLVKKSGIALNEIVVKGRRPIYRQRADGTVEVLIENTTLAASNTVHEILSKSPEIIIDESGGISVFGKGNAIIFLNGRRITANQLALIAPTNIKKIEIIRNPSAKYDADGGAVINISTIQKRRNGYQVNLKQNATYSDFGGANFHSSFNLNYKQGRFSSNVNYALLTGKDRELLYTTRDRIVADEFLKTDLTTDWQRKFDNYSYYGVGLQLDGKKNDYVSLEYAGSSEQLGGNQFSNNKITDNEGISFYKSDVARDEGNMNNSLSLNYHQSLDTLGSTLFLGGQYAKFTGDTDNFITEESELTTGDLSRSLKNLSEIDIDLYSAQIDFTKKYNNKNTFEIGAKYSLVDNGFYLDFFVADDGVNFILNNDLSNTFNYKEMVGAAYFTFKSNLNENINYAFGLRSEWTDYNLDISSQVDLITDRYINFFPNFSTNINFSENNHLNFSYTSKINRPHYHNLNPILYYQDPYTSIQGNPNLIPEKTHAFEVGTRFNKTTFKVGYNYTMDPRGGRAIRGEDDKSYVLIVLNFDKRHDFFSSVSRTFNKDWWTSINTFSLRQTNIIEKDLGIDRADPKPFVYLYSNNIFRVSNLFNVEVLFWYLGKRYTGITLRQQRSNLMVTVEKSFFNNALKCRFIANDIFNNTAAVGDYNLGETDIYFNRRWSNNYFRFSVIYDFGKLKKNNYKNKAIGETESNRI